MPNSRRRRFSVQNKTESSIPAEQNDAIHSGKLNQESSTNLKQRRRFAPNITPYANKTLEIVPECDSVSLEKNSATLKAEILKQKDDITFTVDKDVTASSSNIDFFNIQSTSDEVSVASSKDTIYTKENIITKEHRSKIENYKEPNRERMSLRKDKVPRQHRVKVRSPKRRISILETEIKDITPIRSYRSVEVDAIIWSKEMQENSIPEVLTNVVEVADEIRESEHSLDDMCRICHGGDSLSAELGPLISACSCRGTVARVHVKCLERWLTESGKSRCELCGTRYMTRRVHRYGVPRALVMWILSQNAKQLMVDSLGIMLMSPLAVLAAWLSGRTLAGLMTQESHVTPWPLASTFVLACMTLFRRPGYLSEMWMSYEHISASPRPLASTFILSCMAVMFWRPDYLSDPWLTWEGIYGPQWPLISTFVVACMTLVCYYCWIVSAATRHALSWWIWYRSQYEVRLQLQDSDE